MKILKKLFFGINMTWKKVILFAIITAILVAAILILPGISSTSIANIGVTFEFWIFAALVIIMNCEKPLEAGLKTFVFFLISQPLIYLLQVPFNFLGWGIFMYYPRWLIWTILCLPGGMIAWFVKADKWYSPLILSVATAFLAYEFMIFLQDLIHYFPKGLAATVFTGILVILLIIVILKQCKHRLLAGGITLLASICAAAFLFFFSSGNSASYEYDLADGHDWEIASQDGYIGEITFSESEDASMTVHATQSGTCELTIANEAGESLSFHIVYDGFSDLQVIEVP